MASLRERLDETARKLQNRALRPGDEILFPSPSIDFSVAQVLRLDFPSLLFILHLPVRHVENQNRGSFKSLPSEIFQSFARLKGIPRKNNVAAIPPTRLEWKRGSQYIRKFGVLCQFWIKSYFCVFLGEILTFGARNVHAIFKNSTYKWEYNE